MMNFTDPKVKAKFDAYPEMVRDKMLKLREIILVEAERTEGVGEIQETLKWGEPAYLTSQTKSGTTIRIDWKEKHPDQYAIYVNCNTTLVDQFRGLFGDILTFEGERGVILGIKETLPINEVGICIQMALTYHLNKSR